MNQLPRPPDAYWAQIPWWGYIGFLIVALLIVVVIGPWLIQRARNQPSAILSREQILLMREGAFHDRQEHELEDTRADRDRGWSIARGWIAVAHQLWHDQANAVQRFNDLLLLCTRLADGRYTLQTFQERVADIKPIKAPKPLPAPEAVDPKKPGETEYA